MVRCFWCEMLVFCVCFHVTSFSTVASRSLSAASALARRLWLSSSFVSSEAAFDLALASSLDACCLASTICFSICLSACSSGSMDSNQHRGQYRGMGKRIAARQRESEPKHTQRGGWRRNSGGGVAWRRDGGVCVQGVGWGWVGAGVKTVCLFCLCALFGLAQLDRCRRDAAWGELAEL